MPIVDILDIEQSGLDGRLNCGGAIDVPQPTAALDWYAIPIQGWALGIHGLPGAIEIRCDDQVVGRASCGIARPDVGLHFSHLVHAGQSGFATTISALDLPPTFEITVEVADQPSRVVVGRIRGQRRALKGDAGTGPQPIMLTTLGRTGSSLLMTCLRAHPEVLCHGSFPYETRLLSYWSSVFSALSAPKSAVQPIMTNGLVPYWWLGDASFPVYAVLGSDPAFGWALGDNIDALSTLCCDRISGFYRWYSEHVGRPAARYFVEKLLPMPDVQGRLFEQFPHAREVFLVRDPRDMVASIFAFNQKRGSVDFGRAVADSDAAFVGQINYAMTELMQAWKRRGPRAHLVHYESLVLREAETLTALFTYLGVDASPAVVDAVRREVAAADPATINAHRTIADATATVGRWRTDLAADVVAAADQQLQPVLREFGYDDVAALPV